MRRRLVRLRGLWLVATCMRINDNDDDDDQDDDGGGGGVPERRSVAVAGLRRYCLPYMTRAFSSSTPHTHGKIAIAEMNTLADQKKKTSAGN